VNALGTAIWAYGIAPLLHALFCCRGRAIFSHLFAFCGIPACCRRASSDSYSTIIPPPCRKHRKHSTVPHSAVNPRNKQQSKYAPITARQRRHADGVGSRQHVVEHIYRSLCPQSERINRHMLGLRKHGGVMREGFACTLFFSLRPFYFFHTCGVRVVLGGHGALGICNSPRTKFAPKTVDLSVRFSHSHLVQLFL